MILTISTTIRIISFKPAAACTDLVTCRVPWRDVSAHILEQCPPPAGMGDPPSGYYKIFDRGNLRLYRRADLLKNAAN